MNYAGYPYPTRTYPWEKLKVNECLVISDKSKWRTHRHAVYRLNHKSKGIPLFGTKVENGMLHIWRHA